MPRTIASDNIFDVLPPGLFRGLKVMLGFGELEEMNWRVLHKPSGTLFRLTQEQHAEIEELSKDLPGQGAQLRKDSRDILLKQVQKYWQDQQSAD
jgi:hypothetical protein